MLRKNSSIQSLRPRVGSGARRGGGFSARKSARMFSCLQAKRNSTSALGSRRRTTAPRARGTGEERLAEQPALEQGLDRARRVALPGRRDGDERLEVAVVEAVREDVLEHLLAGDDEAALVVAQLHPEQGVQQEVESLAQDVARVLEPPDRAAIALHEIDVRVLDLAQQPIHVLGEVLQVRVDEADVDALRRLQARAPAGLDPAIDRVVDRDDVRMLARERVDDGPGVVAAAVVDEDDLAVDALALERAIQPLRQLRAGSGLR